MTDQPPTKEFIILTQYQFAWINFGFGLAGAFIGGWFSHYLADRRNRKERFINAYEPFSKTFIPAFEMIKDKQTTFEQIIFSEFPKHKEAKTTLLHIHPLIWYRRFYFNRKWNEYEKAYNDLKDYLKPLEFPEALLVARRGEKEDIKRKQEFLGHLQSLLKIAKQY